MNSNFLFRYVGIPSDAANHLKWSVDSFSPDAFVEASGQRGCAFRGWVLSNSGREVCVAAKASGVTRCYPLNSTRADVVELVLMERPEGHEKLVCGFRVDLKVDDVVDVGFECDGVIFWVYRIEPVGTSFNFLL